MLPTGLAECFDRVETPAFLYDAALIVATLDELRSLVEPVGGKLLYSTKAFGFFDALLVIAPYVDGLSVSSLFEALLAREAIGAGGFVQFVSPGIRPGELRQLAELCDLLTLNSLSQLRRYTSFGKASVGVRVNPEIDYVHDPRFAPSGAFSKLGIPLPQVHDASALIDPALVRGIHFHNNCDSKELRHLWETVHVVADRLEWFLGSVDWINLGGGYCVAKASDRCLLTQAVAFLRDKFGIDVFFEPGAAVVQDAGVLISTVIDAFSSGTSEMLVLDTTVNHLPDTFAYQISPDVLGSRPGGTYRYFLTGSTCLAGDRFGEYGFDEPIEVGSRIVFPSVGAYAWVKAHTFNGIPIPNLYMLYPNGSLSLLRKFTYDDYARLQGFPVEMCARMPS